MTCLITIARPYLFTRLVIGTLVLVLADASFAGVAGSFGVDRIDGDDWAIEDVRIAATSLDAANLALTLTLAKLELPQQHGALSDVRLSCATVFVEDAGWQCVDGELLIGDSPVGAQQATWIASYRSGSDWALSLRQLRLARGTVDVDLVSAAGIPRMTVVPRQLQIDGLATWLPDDLALRDWQPQGEASGRFRLAWVAGMPADLKGELAVTGFAYGSEDGTQAAEKVVVKADLEATRQGESWALRLKVAAPKGGLYTEPLFLELDTAALTADADVIWSPESGRLVVQALRADMAGAVAISGTGTWDTLQGRADDMTIVIRSDEAGGLYQRLLQPYLIGTLGDDLEVVGQVGVVLHADAAGVDQLGLNVRDFSAADNLGRFAVNGVAGNVAWDRTAEPSASQVSIASAGLFGIETGSFEMRARFAGDRLDLLDSITVPVLQGRVSLDTFAMRGLLVAGEAPSWEATVGVEDVSLEDLTTRLGWPPFGGEVGGRFEQMRYADQVFRAGGRVGLEAFDGRIEVNGLEVQEPFGTVPILKGDVTLRGLDLEQLTGTFSLGWVTGGLDGDVDGLRLVGWQPDRFDLHLYTVDNGSRRRISQRAVENLTEVGSGVPAGLSTGVLRIFEDFAYEAIDLKVDLQGDVATLGGLARDDGGYYLVKGSGLPRIDVIGRNRRVNWRDLVERLREIQVEEIEIR